MRYNSETREVTMTAAQAWALMGCVYFVMKRGGKLDIEAAECLAASGAALIGADDLPIGEQNQVRFGLEAGTAFVAMVEELEDMVDEYGREQIQKMKDRMGRVE